MKNGNCGKKEEFIHCKIQAELKAALIARAKKENSSLGKAVRDAIRSYVGKNK